MRFILRVSVLFFLLTLFGLSWQVRAVSGEESGGPFFQMETTTAFRAVFAQFLSVVPNEEDPSLSVDCAISISNICRAPPSLEPLLGIGPRDGRVALFLYDRDGSLTTFLTTSDAIGTGLTPTGALMAGQTWTVRLAEVLAEARGIPEREVTFNGYGWILSGFDCLAGTYNNTIFGLGFTQNFEMLPGLGQGGFVGGLQIPPAQ